MDKVLQMNFRTGVGRNMRISLEDPREDITAEDIKAVMNLIISKISSMWKGIGRYRQRLYSNYSNTAGGL